MTRQGWFKDSYRHALAAKGVKTSKYKHNNKVRLQTVSRGQDTSGAQDLPPVNIVPERLTSQAEINKRIGRDIAREVKLGLQAEGRSDVSLPGPAAIRQREQTEEAIVESRIKRPLFDMLDRVEAGDFSGILNPDGSLKGQYANLTGADQLRLKDAIFAGARQYADRGANLKEIAGATDSLTQTQKEILERQSRLVRTGSIETPAGRAGDFAKSVGLDALEGAEGGVRKVAGGVERQFESGLKNAKTELLRREPSALEKREKEVAELAERRRLEKKEQELERGVLNPLGIEFFGGEQAVDGIKKHVPDALKAEMEVNELYNSKDRLSKVDVSSYRDGERAFKEGDRPKLVESINKLEAENAKLKDRWHITQKVRSVVVSNKNIDQSTVLENYGMEKPLPNALFGGGAGDKLADQTRKISEVEREIKDSSNKLTSRIGLLRQKLRRMNAATPPETTVPEKITVIESNGAGFGSLSKMLDSAKGSVYNPLIGDDKVQR